MSLGSTIYSDGWSAYCDLNSLGFKHFTVIHKYSFKKVYVKQGTDEKVVVHTNQLEGAWKHVKQHFRKMSGTQRSQFEGHLAEIMWRSWSNGAIYENFFQLLRSVYTLEGPPEYTYSTPLFDTWSAELDSSQDGWSIIPTTSDMESESDSQSKEDRHPGVDPVEVSSDSDIPPNKPVRSKTAMPDAMTTSQMLSMFESSCSLSSDDPDRTLTEDMPKESNI